MDEDETEDYTVAPMRHDRWSVLIVGLNFATQIVTTTANTLEQYTLMAAQHANQVKYDKRFGAMMEPLKIWNR